MFQIREARILLDCDYRTHSIDMLSEPIWPTLRIE